MVYIGGSGSGLGQAKSRFGDNSGGSYPYGYHAYSNIRSISISFLFGTQGEDVYSDARSRAYYTSFTKSDDQPHDGMGLELLKEPWYFLEEKFFDINNHPEYSWFNTNIGFGEPNSELIMPTVRRHEPINSKTGGPAFHPGWKVVGSSSGFDPWEGDSKKIRAPN